MVRHKMYLSLNTFLLYTTGLLLSTPRLSNAVQCGKWYSNSCLGETDKRYDPDASNAIKDQSDFHKHREGLWIRTYYSYGADGNPMTPSSPRNLQPYVSKFPYMTFENYTYTGSRLYSATYNVYPPLNTTQFPGVCDNLQEPIPNFQCGVHGMILFQGAFATSTYEKDGSTTQFAAGKVFNPAEDIDYTALLEQTPGKIYGPVSEGKRVVGITNAVDGRTFATGSTNLDPEKTIDNVTRSVYTQDNILDMSNRLLFEGQISPINEGYGPPLPLYEESRNILFDEGSQQQVTAGEENLFVSDLCSEGSVACQRTEASVSSAVDEKTFATASIFSQVIIFLDSEKTIDSVTRSVYAPTVNGDIVALNTLKGIGKKVSEEEWLQTLEISMTENNVINPQPLPMSSTCLIECPSEENWCTTDPECSESPYQEPEGKVLPEVIGGFCALGAAILLGLAVTCFKHRLRVQDKRVRSHFARRIAASMVITGAEEALTMENLMKEFQRINADNSGKISKDELHDFLMDGKIGSVTEADFNALFIALDKDNNGSVDFVQFVAFMSGCEDELAVAGNLSTEEKICRLSKAIIRKSRATLNAVAVEDLEDGIDSK